MTHLRRLPILTLTLAALLCLGCETATKIDLLRVVTSGRDGWQKPDLVLGAIEIAPGDRVAEIGAGSGYWLPFLSRAVGPKGRVYAVEVEAELVEALEARVKRDGLGNVEVLLGRYEDPLLPDAGIDLAITSLTYHHIEDREAYFSRLRSDLSASGRVVHLDGRDDVPLPFRWMQSAGHWSNVNDMNEEMNSAGYARVASFDFLAMESLQIFAPVPAER